MNQYNGNYGNNNIVNSNPSMGRPMNGYNKSPLAGAATVSSNNGYNRPYNTMRPSPLANAATIKPSNTIDEQYRKNQMNRESENHKNNFSPNGDHFNNVNILTDEIKALFNEPDEPDEVDEIEEPIESIETDETTNGKTTDEKAKSSGFMKKAKHILPGIKLKINVPKKQSKVITVNTNHPERNSSLFNKK